MRKPPTSEYAPETKTPIRPVPPQLTVSHVVGTEALREKLIVRNLDFYYDAAQALFGIDVTFYDKSVTALIGPSGCGKSTLLRVLNRIYQLYPSQRATGEVLLDGKNILDPAVDVRWLRSRVGMLAQKPMPFPMSIYENIAFGIRLYQILPRRELDERVEEALRRAALWNEVKDILNHNGLSLSGGQQQRLCVARAIAVSPEVILFDEPCSAQRDYCIVIVTHNMQQAARVSDRTAFMYLGRIIECDTTEKIFTHPRDPHTEAYVTERFG